MAVHSPIESEIVFTALGGLPRPPVDLDRIAAHVGVDDVLTTSFRDGYTDFSYTDFSRKRPVIYLSEFDDALRIRFVFAHELAHVMLRMPRVRHLIQIRGEARILTDEEQLADRIAATLLVPESWIDPFRVATPSPLSRFTDIAERARISPAMLVRRMVISGIDVAMLHWRRGEVNWHVIDRPGAPASLYADVKPSMVGQWAIEELDDGESNIIVDCRVGRRHIRVGGSALRTRCGRPLLSLQKNDALQLIRPLQDVWTAPESRGQIWPDNVPLADVKHGNQRISSVQVGSHGLADRTPYSIAIPQR